MHQRSKKMKGRNRDGGRVGKELDVAVFDRGLEGCANAEMGKVSLIKNENRKEHLYPRSGYLNQVKLAEIASRN